MLNIIDPAYVKIQLEALANDIEEKSGDTKAANRLRNLRDAVDGGNQADAWASADINKLINPEQIVEYYRNQPIADSVASTLEFVRNILIFLPLLVSWFGISQAVSKYGDFLGKNQDQLTQPFLYLWQTGFGNQLPFIFRLGFLAGLDAVLILLLVGVSVGHSFLADLGKQGRFKEAERLRSDLANALAGATLCLATRNRQQPTNVADAFDRTARLFGETTDAALSQMRRDGDDGVFFMIRNPVELRLLKSYA
ncbi:MAG: hypothetical protein ABI379_03360 [Rhodanobacter sp.]